MSFNRRKFLQLLGATSAVSAAGWWQQNVVAQSLVADKGLYDLPLKGSVRILHTTDAHGQLLPVYFREPNVNLGLDKSYGKMPHVVGKKFLSKMKIKPNSPEAYAYTYLYFDKVAKQYGKTGGFAQLKTLLDKLRHQAGGIANTITLDGGDLWQGSGTSLWTRGVDMVEASNILGVDVMVGHWEFTYHEQEVLNNVALFKGDFIGQNVRVKEDALMDDDYLAMAERNNGLGLFNEDEGYAFKPYIIRTIAGKKIAIVGQAFPRTATANPPEFFPDWSFGIRQDDMRDLVKKIHAEEKPNAVVLISHNGMDVDLKMAENVAGIDVIFGGHTHDGVPHPTPIKNPQGKKCLVTNAGSNSKFVGVMDLEFDGDKLKNSHYKMLPVIANMLKPAPEMQAFISQMRQQKYTNKIVESRDKNRRFNKHRLGKTFDAILTEKLAIADRLLYRRGNFMGTWDQILCNALRAEYQADIALSPGVRWGTTNLQGDWITMEDVMNQCSMTYAETYVNQLTGKDLLNILEQVADNLFDPNPYLQSGGDMVRVGGLDYTINPNKKLYHRISNLKLDNGEVIQADKKYSVAGWAVVNRTPDGKLMWDVVREYIIKNRSKDNVLRLPKINNPKLLGVKNNPGLADYGGKLG